MTSSDVLSKGKWYGKIIFREEGVVNYIEAESQMEAYAFVKK